MKKFSPVKVANLLHEKKWDGTRGMCATHLVGKVKEKRLWKLVTAVRLRKGSSRGHFINWGQREKPGSSETEDLPVQLVS